jgi:hypothetical protein
MKNFLSPLWSKGMLVFAIILFVLNLLSILYFQGFKSIWLVFVIEFAAIVSYVISRNISNAEDNIWKVGNTIPDEV